METTQHHTVTEYDIRQRSYGIWQREGCPHGKHDEHWRRAEAELASESNPLVLSASPAADKTAEKKSKSRPAPDKGKTKTAKSAKRSPREKS